MESLVINSDLKYYLNPMQKNKEYIIERSDDFKLVGRVQSEEITNEEAEYYTKLMTASPRLLKSLVYAKSLIDKLEESHPEIAHKLMGVDEMIEIEKIINELNK